MITIERVRSRADWRRFVSLPWSIYRGNPHWVPPLRIAVRDVLDTVKNPFFRHAELLPLLAVDDGRVVGRVAGIVDHVHNRFHGERTGFFGFFESVNDQAVCDTLLGAVESWLREHGMAHLRGPVNPSTNHECGLLIEGFDKSPRVMMTYNPEYYHALLDGYGLAKAKDLTAWDVSAANPFTERLMKVAERQRRHAKISVRPIDLKRFDDEIRLIMDIYNQAWGRNWGFVPLDQTEFQYIARDMRLVLDPSLCLLVYVGDEPAAFGLALPNLNQVLKKIPDGRLLPYGIAKLLWHYFGPGRRSTVTEMRILTLGIKQQFRQLGLGALLYLEYLQRGTARGVSAAEASWILEDNQDMVRSLEAMNASITRRYRIYQKPVAT